MPPARLALHARGSHHSSRSRTEFAADLARMATRRPGLFCFRRINMQASSLRAAVLAAAVVSSASAASAQPAKSPAGLWDATVVVQTGPSTAPVPVEIPFRFEIACGGAACAAPKGSFFNGDDRVTSTTGTFANGALTLSFDEYGTTLEATLKDGRLEGRYARGTRGAPYPFQARRFSAIDVGDATIPSI